MTGLRFLLRVTLRRLDLAAEIYHIREPQKILLVMSPDETKRLLAVARNLKVRVLLSLGYGCGLRAGEVIRLKVKHIDSAQKIIRVEQSKGRKDRNVMLSPELHAGRSGLSGVRLQRTLQPSHHLARPFPAAGLVHEAGPVERQRPDQKLARNPLNPSPEPFTDVRVRLLRRARCDFDLAITIRGCRHGWLTDWQGVGLS
jgi:integrase